MSKVLTGVTTIINGNSNCTVLASIIANLSYQDLDNAASGRPEVTQAQFDRFIAETAGAFIEAGILDDQLNLTGSFTVKAS